MTEPVRFYYRTADIAFPFVALAAMGVFLVWSPFDSTYFGFLEHYPGRALIFVIVGVYAIALMWLLPTLVRSIARIPAVEYDGRTLLVRGWTDRSFDTLEGDIRVKEGSQQVIVSADGYPSASIPLRHIEGPKSLIDFLNGLAVSRP